MKKYENLNAKTINGIKYVYQLPIDCDKDVEWPDILQYTFVALKDGKIVYLHPDLEECQIIRDDDNNRIIAKNGEEEFVIEIPSDDLDKDGGKGAK